MNRSLRLLAVFVVATGFAAAGPGTASAQLDVDELAAAEAEIIAEIEAIDAQIATTENQLAGTLDALARAEADAVMIRRDLAAAHHHHDTAVNALRNLAVQRYVLGDPRLEDFVNEIVEERASVEPAINRALYTQVLERADGAAISAEQRVHEIRDSLGDRRRDAADRADEIPVIRGDIEELNVERDAAAERLANVQVELEWERSLLRRARLTGRDDGTDNTRPVLAVKIDNVSRARPQTGINQADVVFEELVEGNLTRLVALFHSTGSDPVGPIRSVRTSDVHILANLNRPLLGNSGGNPGVMQALRESPIIDVGALSPIAARFFRSPGRPAPNNLFSNTTDLWAAGAGSEAGSAPPMFSFRRPGEPWGGDAVASNGVNINFGSTRVTYRWSADRGGWLRTQDGSPHVDTDGIQASPTNVVVLDIDYQPTPFAVVSPEAQVVGEGPVLVFSNGEMRQGTWRRDGPEIPTRYLDSNGNEIELLPGTTWIEFAPQGSATIAG